MHNHNKFKVITAYVHSAHAAGLAGMWLVAQSNVAVKNIAEKLVDTGFEPWKLLVSKDFHFEWYVFYFTQQFFLLIIF